MSSSTNSEKIFYEALEIESEAERNAFLKGACGADAELRAEVDELLAAHGDAGSFMAGTMEFGVPEPELSHIGPYKLLEEIGEGGMGSVWVAQQSKPIKRKVAIKLIKAGMDSKSVLARFEAERQALALMDHPNIAWVLDGGMTDQGRPYFAMEYVKGVPLNEYCNQAKLSVEERLELFLPVCHAVQHAHQKGIIHRDLKPTNILVCLYDGKPVPKVIDFGLAKAMHQSLTENTLHTGHGMMLGTPLYMSPEQAESNNLDVDTRTDIYSLGVILYELLTGTTPLEKAQFKEAAVAEMLRMIKEVEPPKPSTRLSGSADLPNVAAQRNIDPNHLQRSVSGDLDWVIMKALEKDRGRRYESANGLAEDIVRHLSDEPVSASPPSKLYRLRKFVRRNRVGVIAASLVSVALILGVMGTSWGMWNAQVAAAREAHQRQIAEENAEKAKVAVDEEVKQRKIAEVNEKKAISAVAQATRRSEELAQVSKFQADQLSFIDLGAMGARLRDDILERVRTSALDAGETQKDVEKKVDDLRQTLKSIQFMDVARKSLDENILDRALKTIREEFSDQPLVKASLLQSVATTLEELSLFKKAVDPQTEALKIRREQLPKGDERILESVLQTGFLMLNSADMSNAAKHIVEAFEDSQKYLGREHQVTILSKIRLATLPFPLPENLASTKEELLREALADARRFLGAEHACTGRASGYLGMRLVESGSKDGSKLAEAEGLLKESIAISLKVSGPHHKRTYTPKWWLAATYRVQNRHAEAEKLLRELVILIETILGEENSFASSVYKDLAYVLSNQGKFDEAIQRMARVREIILATQPDGSPFNLIAGKFYADILLAAGKDAEAEKVLRGAIDLYGPIVGKLSGRQNAYLAAYLAKSKQMLGSILVRKGSDFLAAEKNLVSAFEMFPENHQIDLELGAKSRSDFARPIVELYEAWHKAEPNAGKDAKAAEWIEKLKTLDALDGATPSAK